MRKRTWWTSALVALAMSVALARQGEQTNGTDAQLFRTIMPKPSFGGTLSTASGLVFAGEEDGNVMAFDAASGKNLWRLQTGAGVRAGPMTFTHDGKQYVVAASGGTVIAFALPDGR